MVVRSGGKDVQQQHHKSRNRPLQNCFLRSLCVSVDVPSSHPGPDLSSRSPFSSLFSSLCLWLFA